MKYGRKMEIGRVKSQKSGVLKAMGMEMVKIGEKEDLKMKNNGRFCVKVEKVSKKGRNLMDFGEELTV